MLIKCYGTRKKCLTTEHDLDLKNHGTSSDLTLLVAMVGYLKQSLLSLPSRMSKIIYNLNI